MKDMLVFVCLYNWSIKLDGLATDDQHSMGKKTIIGRHLKAIDGSLGIVLCNDCKDLNHILPFTKKRGVYGRDRTISGCETHTS